MRHFLYIQVPRTMAPGIKLLLPWLLLLGLTTGTVHGYFWGEDGQSTEISGCTVSGSNVTCRGDSVTEIPKDLSSSITLISFDSTKVTQIPDDAFVNYPDLSIIHFRKTALKSISKGAFRGLSNLRELTLRWNVISDASFENEEYEGLSALETLDICQNYQGLTKLPLGLLQGATNLKLIRAFLNSINELPSELDFNMTQLSYLDLTFGALTSIDTAFFKHTPNIEFISVDTNRISTIQNGTYFMQLPKLEDLFIRKNPLICDCHAFWMMEAREAAKPWALNWYENSPSCGSPDWFPDITELYREDFTCETPDVEPLTATNLNHTQHKTLTLKAKMTKGYPSSKWLLPNGKLISGNDSVEVTDHSVVATLVRKDIEITGLVNFTLIASNVMGPSEEHLTFWVDIEPDPTTAPGAAVGGPPVGTATLLLMLMCACIFTG